MIYPYQVLKTSWGVRVSLDVEEMINPAVSDTDIKIADLIYLRISPEIKWPQELFRPWIENGIKALNYEILKRIAPKSHVCFLLKNVDFALTDFQQEGFYCAIQGWLAIYYDFEIKPITVDYDKHNNKYVFGIPN